MDLKGHANLIHWWRMGDAPLGEDPDAIGEDGIVDRAGENHGTTYDMDASNFADFVP
jgi:hypothetical protein